MQNSYENIDDLNSQTNKLYDEQMKQQQNIINTSTQQLVDEIEKNKQKAEEDNLKTNKALYTDYQKQINPYGVNAENLAEQGLNNSGLAETTKANYYNSYQNARNEAINNANKIKADFDSQIVRARQNGDIQLAQSALEMYKQKVQDLYNTYNLKYQQDQFVYQKEQDALAQSNWLKEYEQAVKQAQWQQQFNQAQFDYNKSQDVLAQNNWQKEFDYNKNINDRNYNYQINRDNIANSQWQQNFNYNKSVDDRNYNYQINRDKVSDSQWQKEYELSKKAKSSSGSSKKHSSSNNTLNISNINNINDISNTKVPTSDEVLKNIQIIQGSNLTNNIKDTVSGKIFGSVDELLAYYGYASID